MSALPPLPYQRAVVDILRRENPNSFEALRASRSDDTSALDQALLRAAYRVDEAGHPEVFGPVRLAAERLGIEVPIEIYAEADATANAELIYLPSRAVLLFSGPTLNQLDPDELAAVAGHELAHHVLWSADRGAYLAAARLLDTAESDGRTPSEYLETARRYRLATELFADRGGLLGSGSLTATVSGLLKITTGLAKVSVESYLRQADEVDFTQESAGRTHPETVLRAWALRAWSERGDAAEPEIVATLTAELDLAALDIVGQDALAELTRELVAFLIAEPTIRGEDTAVLAGRYGVTGSSKSQRPELAGRALSTETRRYLAAVLLDFGTADEDASGEVLSTVLAHARGLGLGTELERMIDAELDLGSRGRTTVLNRANELEAEFAVQAGTWLEARNENGL